MEGPRSPKGMFSNNAVGRGRPSEEGERSIDLASLRGRAIPTKTSENVTPRSRGFPDLLRYVVVPAAAPPAPALLPSLNGNEPESIRPCV